MAVESMVYYKRNRTIVEDTFISFAVMLSPALNVLQNIMNDVFYMEETSTTYRVILTAIPLSIAIFLGFIRKPRRFIVVFSIALAILFIHLALFPVNADYALKDAFRFTFPIVISSALCLSCVSRIEIIEKVLYQISWIVLFLVVFYVYSFFTGKIDLGNYSMSMSYAMLLPMASLYSRKKWYSILAFLFLLVVSLLIGSRGAIVCIFIYILYDLFKNNIKSLVFIFLLILMSYAMLPMIMNSLDNVGISSRTLNMIVEGSIGQETHRDEIREIVYKEIKANPIVGVGVWGDRPILIPKFSKASYCHNIVLEILLDFGIIFGTIILLVLFCLWLNAFFKADSYNKRMLILFTATCLLPLMFSGSYLLEQFFGLFLGVVFVVLNRKKGDKSITYLQ
jgi:hypothetical protein